MSELSFTPCCHGDAAHQPLRMPNELWLLPCPCAPRGQREGPSVLPWAAQREPAGHPHLFPSATAPANLCLEDRWLCLVFVVVVCWW